MENDKKCGNLLSVSQGWQCSKCGIIKHLTNEIWEKQKDCAKKSKALLPNGLWKIQKEIQISDIQEKLYEYLEIAVGIENGKWFVQTTDKLRKTYLSSEIAEELDTKEQAMDIARNISFITGMKIQEWNVEEN